MNLFSLRIHAILDYILALLMLLTPWLVGFEDGSVERSLVISLGIAKLIYSLCTDYELGFLEEIEVRTHLLLDFLIGILLILSPWLFGFYYKFYLPYIVLGVVELSTTFLTNIDEKIFKNLKKSGHKEDLTIQKKLSEL